MPYDFNSADRQTSFELIPAGTIVRLGMVIRPGGGNEDGWLTQSKNSDSQYFSCEFTVMEGPYARRKIFQNIGWSGGKVDDKGNSIYGNMGRTTLRAIMESARGISPEDQSEKARQARQLNGWGDFNGMVFLAKLGVEKGTDGYADKNKILTVITPDMKDFQQAGPGTGAGVFPQPPVAPSAPPWAQTPAPSQQVNRQAAPPTAPAAAPVPAWAR